METYNIQPEPNLPHRLIHGLGQLALMVGKSFQYMGLGGLWVAPRTAKTNNSYIDSTPCASDWAYVSTEENEPVPVFKTAYGFRQRLSQKDRLDLHMLDWDKVTLEEIKQYCQAEPLKPTLRDRCEIWLLTSSQIPFNLIDSIEHNDLGYKEQ